MKKSVQTVLIYLAVAVWFGFFACQSFDIHHDGIMLGAAALCAEGKLLFKEVFCQYGPLAVWIQALAVKLFGAEDFVIKMLTVLFYGGVYLLADNIYSKRLSPPFRWIWRGLFFGLCSFYMVPFHPWSSVYALFFMFLAAHFMLKFIENEEAKNLLMVGFFSGAASLCRTPCGAVPLIAAALMLWLLRKPRPTYGRLFGGFGIVCGLFVLYLILAGAVGDYLRQCFGFIFGFVVKRGGKFHIAQVWESFFPVIDSTGFADCIFALLPLIALAFLVALWRRKEHDKACAEQIFLAFFALGSWHQYFPVPCVRHLYWAGIPLFGAAALAAQMLWNSKQTRGFKLLLTGTACAAALFCIFPRACSVVQRFLKWPTRQEAFVPSLRHQMLFKNENDAMSMLYQAWAQLPVELKMRGVLNHTPDGLFTAMFPPAMPPTPMFVNWGRDVYQDYPETVMRYIYEKRPSVLTTEFVQLPGYIELCGFSYYNKPYRLFVPEQ